MSTL
ncbi:Protein CBG26800 [Caenorhabditis briggsae]|jgi:hypothetical protein